MLKRSSILLILAIILLNAVACKNYLSPSNWRGESISSITCEEVVSKSKKLPELINEQYYQPFMKPEYSQKLMKILDISEISRTEKKLSCEGTAKFTNAEKYKILFNRYVDEDGDFFVEWRRK